MKKEINADRKALRQMMMCRQVTSWKGSNIWLSNFNWKMDAQRRGGYYL